MNEVKELENTVSKLKTYLKMSIDNCDEILEQIKTEDPVEYWMIDSEISDLLQDYRMDKYSPIQEIMSSIKKFKEYQQKIENY